MVLQSQGLFQHLTQKSHRTNKVPFNILDFEDQKSIYANEKRATNVESLETHTTTYDVKMIPNEAQGDSFCATSQFAHIVESPTLQIEEEGWPRGKIQQPSKMLCTISNLQQSSGLKEMKVVCFMMSRWPPQNNEFSEREGHLKVPKG